MEVSFGHLDQRRVKEEPTRSSRRRRDDRPGPSWRRPRRDLAPAALSLGMRGRTTVTRRSSAWITTWTCWSTKPVHSRAANRFSTGVARGVGPSSARAHRAAAIRPASALPRRSASSALRATLNRAPKATRLTTVWQQIGSKSRKTARFWPPATLQQGLENQNGCADFEFNSGWRRCMGVEPTLDQEAGRATVLKTARPTGTRPPPGASRFCSKVWSSAAPRR